MQMEGCSGASIPLHFQLRVMEKLLQRQVQVLMICKAFKNLSIKPFSGKCLVIVRPKGNGGKIILKAKGEGLSEGQVVIEAK